MRETFSKVLIVILLCLAGSAWGGGSIIKNTIAAEQYLYAPRLTTTEIAALSPVEGAIVYDTVLNELQTYNGSSWVAAGENDFLSLSDTPSTYTASKSPRVNAAGTALEWVDQNDHLHTIADISDMPASFSGEGGKVLAVNTGETAVEYVNSTTLSIDADNLSTGTVPTTRLSDFVGTDSISPGVKGAVPAPTIADAAKFLQGDGTWGTVTVGTVHYYDLVETPGAMAGGNDYVAVTATGGTTLVWTAISAIDLAGSQITSGVVGRSYLQTMTGAGAGVDRSEERRVGKECSSRWSPYH